MALFTQMYELYLTVIGIYIYRHFNVNIGIDYAHSQVVKRKSRVSQVP